MAGSFVANQLNTDTGVFQNNNAFNGMAKAWVSFVGSSGSINNSFNVSSITRSGTGSYIVNMTTAMPSANYVVSVSGQGQSSGSLGCNSIPYTTNASAALVSPTTTTFAFTTWLYNYSSTFDPAIVNAAVFSN